MNSNKTLLRRHPIIILLALLFFAFSLAIILVAYMGAPASAAGRRQRKKVNSYRLPADFTFASAALSPVGSVMTQARIDPVPVEATVSGGVNERLFYAVSLVIGIIAGVLIATMLTGLLIK